MKALSKNSLAALSLLFYINGAAAQNETTKVSDEEIANLSDIHQSLCVFAKDDFKFTSEALETSFSTLRKLEDRDAIAFTTGHANRWLDKQERLVIQFIKHMSFFLDNNLPLGDCEPIKFKRTKIPADIIHHFGGYSL